MSCCSAPIVMPIIYETLLSKCEIPIIDLAHMGKLLLEFLKSSTRDIRSHLRGNVSARARNVILRRTIGACTRFASRDSAEERSRNCLRPYDKVICGVFPHAIVKSRRIAEYVTRTGRGLGPRKISPVRQVGRS
jgi:hypothetical protein